MHPLCRYKQGNNFEPDLSLNIPQKLICSITVDVFVCLSRRSLSSQALMWTPQGHGGEKNCIIIKDEVRETVLHRYCSSSLYLACMCASRCMPWRGLKSTRMGKRCYDQREHAKVFRSISSVPITLFFYTHVRQPRTFVDAFWEKAEKVPRSSH